MLGSDGTTEWFNLLIRMSGSDKATERQRFQREYRFNKISTHIKAPTEARDADQRSAHRGVPHAVEVS